MLRISNPKRLTLLVLFSFVFLFSPAQNIRVDCQNKALNEVLNEWRGTYGLRLSFDETQLSGFRLTHHGEYANPASALQAVLKPFPLAAEQIGDTWVIFPQKPRVVSPVASLVSFQVLDQESRQPLPFCHIETDQSRLLSNELGQFILQLFPDSLRVRASYLGYYQLDTVVVPNDKVDLLLQPSTIGLEEVVVKDRKVHVQTMSLLNSGEIHINHQVGQYLPGSADNAVYNLLRLQPGVMAAGEQANDLVVWGSYSGQTGVEFDGMTLFGLKNYNDNIGAVNPFMVSHVNLHKGGYAAAFGDKSGGLVEITGVSQMAKKPSLIFSATNFVLNTKAALPLSSRTDLHFAFRQTYYNLYTGDEFSFIPRGNSQMTDMTDLVVVPDYAFRDFTVRLNHAFEDGGQLSFSFLSGKDSLAYSAETVSGGRVIHATSNEGSRQGGLSANYHKLLLNRIQSHFSLSYSTLNREHYIDSRFETPSGIERIRSSSSLHNKIDQIKLEADFQLTAGAKHQLRFGVGFTGSNTAYHLDSLQNEYFETSHSGVLGVAYLQDRYSLTERLSVLPGIRIAYPLYLNRAFLQPRLGISYRLTDQLVAKAGLGQYDQFVVQASMLDDNANYWLFWALADGIDIPVQRAQHATVGLTWNYSFFHFGGEFFYKRMSGLTRYVPSPVIGRDVYTGEANSIGLDVMAQAKIRRHSLWVSYTLSQTLEHFSYMAEDFWQRAPQDQRHEVKLAGMLDFNPWFVSSDYVFGSGFPALSGPYIRQNESDLVYSRWDVSGYYRFAWRRWDIQAGLAIMNVLNNQNVKLQNMVKIGDSMGGSLNIISEAVPFTPTIFLLIRF